MSNKILSSVGSFIGRGNGRNHKLIKELSEKINCDGIEFLVLTPWQENIIEITKELQDLSKPVPIFHFQKEIGELISRNEGNDTEQAIELFKKSCEAAKIINSKQIVLHLWGGTGSDYNIEHNIETCEYLNIIAKKNELLLSIENIPCVAFSPIKYIKKLSKLFSEVYFTFDTKFAQFHNEMNESLFGNLKILWIEKRINHIHINDYSGKYKEWKNLRGKQIGEGNVDFKLLFEHLKKINYPGTITMEAPGFYNNVLNINRINESINFIRDRLK